uniref:EF-hand domain-containing protein n=1 Tax=Globodera rostochiensis TaxID=31243 RepID=A0A914HJ13_GLORO
MEELSRKHAYEVSKDTLEGDKVRAEIVHVLDAENITFLMERKIWPEKFIVDAELLTKQSENSAEESSSLETTKNRQKGESMGNSTTSLMLQEEEVVEIAKDTGFSRNQIVRLYSRFLSLDRQGRGYLDRDDFQRIPELAINPLGGRIVDAFFSGFGESGAKSELINFRQFVKVLAHFRPLSKSKPNVVNSREEKLKFAFSMYDLNKNGYITRDEFKVILNMMVGSNITADQLDSIADRTITEADADKDGKISFDEFCKAMERTDVDQKMSIRFLN